MKIFPKLALLTALVAAVPVMAQEAANANFVAEGGQAFAVVLDGQPLTRKPVRRAHAERLAAGQHMAEFTLAGTRGGSTRLRVKIWLEAGFETSFVLVTPPGASPTLRKVGTVALSGFGPGNPGNANAGYGGQGGAETPGYDGHHAGGYNSGNNMPATSNNYGTANGYSVMSPQDVTALIEALEKRPFEASKLSTAKEALSESSIRAEDLKRLLRALDFESTRIELAKFAHAHVADRQNFYRVYEAFDFDASVREVQEAVAKK